jgi:vesicle coat complex subunit
MQIDDTLILAEQSFADVEEDAIAFVEIIIKARDYLQVNRFLKFNDIIITLNTSSNINVQHLIIIELIKNSSLITISSQDIIRLFLFLREQYVAQRARDVYLIFVY